jgi:hypothetical protein
MVLILETTLEGRLVEEPKRQENDLIGAVFRCDRALSNGLSEDTRPEAMSHGGDAPRWIALGGAKLRNLAQRFRDVELGGVVEVVAASVSKEIATLPIPVYDHAAAAPVEKPGLEVLPMEPAGETARVASRVRTRDSEGLALRASSVDQEYRGLALVAHSRERKLDAEAVPTLHC